MTGERYASLWEKRNYLEWMYLQLYGLSKLTVAGVPLGSVSAPAVGCWLCSQYDA